MALRENHGLAVPDCPVQNGAVLATYLAAWRKEATVWPEFRGSPHNSEPERRKTWQWRLSVLGSRSVAILLQRQLTTRVAWHAYPETSRRTLLKSQMYEITFAGRAGSAVRAAFDDCEVSVALDTTTLRVELPDQAALWGMVQRIMGLGLEVVELRQLTVPASSVDGTAGPMSPGG
jgi:hypothetical protein